MRTWNRNTIDLKEFRKSNIAIHCDTEEKADDLLKYLNSKGIEWCSGEELKYNNYYFWYKELTCYRLNHTGLSYSDIDWWKSNYYDIVEWKIIDENQQVEFKSLNNSEVEEMLNTKIHWKDFVNGEFVIHCKSESEINELLQWIYKNAEDEIKNSPLVTLSEGWLKWQTNVCYYIDCGYISYCDKSNCDDIVLEWNNKYEYHIDGVIETELSEDEFNDKFIDWVESIGASFGGGIKPC